MNLSRSTVLILSVCVSLFKFPGQIELYSHLPVMRQLVDKLQSWDFRMCGIFLIDAQFLVDTPKFFSGKFFALLISLSIMYELG